MVAFTNGHMGWIMGMMISGILITTRNRVKLFSSNLHAGRCVMKRVGTQGVQQQQRKSKAKSTLTLFVSLDWHSQEVPLTNLLFSWFPFPQGLRSVPPWVDGAPLEYQLCNDEWKSDVLGIFHSILPDLLSILFCALLGWYLWTVSTRIPGALNLSWVRKVGGNSRRSEMGEERDWGI